MKNPCGAKCLSKSHVVVRGSRESRKEPLSSGGPAGLESVTYEREVGQELQSMDATMPELAMRSSGFSVGHGLATLAVFVIAVAAAAEDVAGRDMAEHVLAATVGIAAKAADGAASYSGTGTLVTPVGHVLTSTSVVPPDAENIEVMLPGFRRRKATLVKADPALAVSLIAIERETGEDLPSLPVARELPAIGEIAYTASDVDRVMLTSSRSSFSRGLVSGLYDVDPHGESTYAGPAIETTAAVNPGSDGGPLVDSRGRLCGVISLGVSRLRWQGVAVPTEILLEKFPPLRSADVPLAFESPVDLTADQATLSATERATDLARAAAGLAPHLVGVEVSRRFPPEQLHQLSWEEHRAAIKGWDKLPPRERSKRFAAFASLARTLEVNQLLRRPADAVTGLVISPDGLVLTSLFNLGDDTAFVAKATGKPRAFSADEPIEKMLADPPGGISRQPNPVTGVTVVLPDGSRKEANVLSRHEPLGVALLKIDAKDLPFFDLAAAGTSPLLGDAVAVVGRAPGGAANHTFNAGIVSAPSRNRGYQFQTDALLNYGNSGGPVVDAAGNFLGIATAPIEPDTVLGRLFPRPQLMRWTRAPNSGVGMVARADRIAATLEAMKGGRSFDRIPGPFLGVLADTERAFGEDVVIGGVAAGSPADRAGLRKGDRLLEFDGVELNTWRELTERVAASKAGDAVTLLVQRPSRGARLVIAGRDVETLEDLQRLKKSLRPGDTFEGTLTTEDTREIEVVLEENR
jgi:S1-C subfamily serine protease